MAKIVPLSRIPRRLISMTKAMARTLRGTIQASRRPGKAEAMAAIPAATLTETVRT
jgi:hypothetical protein